MLGRMRKHFVGPEEEYGRPQESACLDVHEASDRMWRVLKVYEFFLWFMRGLYCSDWSCIIQSIIGMCNKLL